MKFNVYCMRDEMTGFLTPTFEQNDNVAIRNFKFAMNRPDTLLFANAKHFDLYCIGTFDTESGKIESIEPELIVNGLAVKESE